MKVRARRIGTLRAQSSTESAWLSARQGSGGDVPGFARKLRGFRPGHADAKIDLDATYDNRFVQTYAIKAGQP